MIPATIKHALSATFLALAPLPAFADAQVVMKNFDFAPMAVTIKHGETVVWKNLDGEPHTVVSPDGAFRSQRSIRTTRTNSPSPSRASTNTSARSIPG
ncbi:MAG: plastocyanin/azurin family copper-binding protein [Rhizomicrobium sp.]